MANVKCPSHIVHKDIEKMNRYESFPPEMLTWCNLLICHLHFPLGLWKDPTPGFRSAHCRSIVDTERRLTVSRVPPACSGSQSVPRAVSLFLAWSTLWSLTSWCRPDTALGQWWTRMTAFLVTLQVLLALCLPEFSWEEWDAVHC